MSTDRVCGICGTYFSGEHTCSYPEMKRRIERLTAELEQARAELKKTGCPIGLYKTPEICSAGTCNKCLAGRLERARAELKEAQEQFAFAVKQRAIADEYRQLQIYRAESAEAKNRELAAQMAVMVDTIVFYADPETYFAIGFFPDNPAGQFMEDFEELSGNLGHPDGSSWLKPGKRARQFLTNLPAEAEKLLRLVEAANVYERAWHVWMRLPPRSGEGMQAEMDMRMHHSKLILVIRDLRGKK